MPACRHCRYPLWICNYVLSIINYKPFTFGRIQNYVQKYQNHDIIIIQKIIIQFFCIIIFLITADKDKTERKNT